MTHNFIREKLTRNIDTLYIARNQTLHTAAETFRGMAILSVAVWCILLCIVFFWRGKNTPETPKKSNLVSSQVNTIVMPTIVANREVKYVAPKKQPVIPVVRENPVTKVEWVIIVKQDNSFSVHALANAVAMAETGGCKKGYWVSHNNCHGIKSWNTAPCPWTPKGSMCRFKTTKESYEAFVIIWNKWYKTYPTLQQAKSWTGDDSKETWLAAVRQHYNTGN